MITDIEDEDPIAKPLGRWPIFYYGVGHMLNDITSACWFTYLLVFLTDIGLSPRIAVGLKQSTRELESKSNSLLQAKAIFFCFYLFIFFMQKELDGRNSSSCLVFFWSRNSAIVMLSGQVADGFMTIFCGELIDRFGGFKIWHGAGSLLVAVSFSSVFGGCVLCKILGSDSSASETVGYSLFAAIFNVGWAAAQVSHMSMVNCITLNSTSRVVLTSCRNAFTMVANLSLYAVAFIVFHLSTPRNLADIENQYRWIAYSSILIGCCFVCIFQLGTKEPRLKQGVEGKGYTRIMWTYWFRKLLYYQVAFVYVLTRLVTNVSQAFLAFYVINDLQMAQSSKALVPAIIYICSFIVSILLQEMAWTSQRVKTIYAAGGALWVFCGVGILFLQQSLSPLMYIISVIVGIANALMMVTGVSMQSFLVGQDLNGCAFVYGSLSFLDKMICGLALYVLESYQTDYRNVQSRSASPIISFSITRCAVGLVPAACAFVGIVVTMTMQLEKPAPKPLMDPLLS